jgi:hypothetical protein
VRFSIESHGGAARLLAAASSLVTPVALVWMVFVLRIRTLPLYCHRTQLGHDGG